MISAFEHSIVSVFPNRHPPSYNRQFPIFSELLPPTPSVSKVQARESR
jgi:hypothetical protein